MRAIAPLSGEMLVKRRPDVTTLLDVVDADHGDVVGHDDTEFGEAVQGAEGEQVVEAEDGVRRGARLDQPLDGQQAVVAVPAAGRLDHAARPGRPASLQRLGVAGEAQAGRLGDGRRPGRRWRRCAGDRGRSGGWWRRGPRRRCRWRCGPSSRRVRARRGTRSAPRERVARRSSSPRASGLNTTPSMRWSRMPWRTSSSRSRRPSVWSMSTVQPSCSAASMTPSAISAKYGDVRSGTARAITPVRPPRRLRAVRFGR